MKQKMKGKWGWAFYGAFILAVIGMVAFPLFGGKIEAKKLWLADGLVGDGTSGQSRYLDQIDSTAGVSNLVNGDYAMYFNSGESCFQMFLYVSGITATHNVTTHPYVVVPFDDPTTGVWYEMSGISTWYSP